MRFIPILIRRGEGVDSMGSTATSVTCPGKRLPSADAAMAYVLAIWSWRVLPAA